MTSTGLTVAITGGAGFLGGELARRLLAEPLLQVGGGPPAPLASLVLLDLVAPPGDLTADPRVHASVGDLHRLVPAMEDVDLVCHLAGVVSGAAEADFDLGMRTNLDAHRLLLERCRAMRRPPVLLFTSSLAVFGSDPAIGPVGPVDDDTLPRPQSSYGIQKFIGEQLVADYTRKGFIRGRSVRLMTVAVRPGHPNAAASSFISGIIREPLAGIRAVCPVPDDTQVALSSPGRTLDAIATSIAVDDRVWGSTTAMNLPGLTTTPRKMMEALGRVAGPGAARLVDWVPDPAVHAIVGSWPAGFLTPRAEALGLTAPQTFDDVVREYLVAKGRGDGARAGSAVSGDRLPVDLTPSRRAPPRRAHTQGP